jgi:hypothetical protein
MRKQLALLLITLLALISLVGVVQATPTDDLTALAQYYPSDTPLFASIRIDEGLFDELDAVMFTLSSNLGDQFPVPPGFSTRDLLNMAIGPMLAGRISEAFGTWLGDSAAIGLSSLTGVLPTAMGTPEPPIVIAIEINDRDKAVEFITVIMSLERPSIEPTEVTDDYTLLQLGSETSVFITNDTILFTNDVDTAIAGLEGADGRLSDNPLFADAANALPEDEYDLFFYANVETIANLLVDALTADLEGDGLPPDLLDGLSTAAEASAVSVGLDLSEGRNLVIDLATMMTPDPMMAMLAQTPVNLDFAGHIPADAPLVIMDNAFGPDLLALFALLDTYSTSLQANLDKIMPLIETEMDMDEEGAAIVLEILKGLDLSPIQFGGITKNVITPVFAGFTGLNLEDDVLSWMTGDYAAYLRILPLDGSLPITIDLNFTTEATDPGKAAYIVERLTEVAGLYELEHQTETIGGGDALVYPTLVSSFAPEMKLDNVEELALMIGANNDLLTMGTRPGVEFALAPTGDSLLDDPAFAYARANLFLSDPTSVVYLSPQNLGLTISTLGTEIGRDGQQLLFILNQIESITLSSAAPSDMVSVGRMTLTLTNMAASK